MTWGAWVFIQGGGTSVESLAISVCNLGMVPGELTRMAPLGFGVPLGRGMACVIDSEPINWVTPVISMFLHGSWTYIIGNSLYLWVFGNNVEDSMGAFRNSRCGDAMFRGASRYGHTLVSFLPAHC